MFGEVCSNATALLFAIGVNNRVIQSTSCTSIPFMWLPDKQKVDNASIKDIDFINPKQKMKVVCGSGDSAESTATTSKASESSSAASYAGCHSNILIAKKVVLPIRCSTNLLFSISKYQVSTK